MKKLTEKDVILLMREEWNKKIQSLLTEKSKEPAGKNDSEKENKQVDLSVEVPIKGKKEVVISRGLKVKSKNEFGALQAGTLYTVRHVDKESKTVSLTHEKESGTIKRVVSWGDFSKEFQISAKKDSEEKK